MLHSVPLLAEIAHRPLQVFSLFHSQVARTEIVPTISCACSVHHQSPDSTTLSSAAQQTSNAGQTASSSQDTLPTGTDSPADSTPSTTAPPVLVPVTTAVSEPKKGQEGAQIPCGLWSFVLCIKWPGINRRIQGWEIDLPIGPHRRGPPPPFQSQTDPTLTFGITGTPPPWPDFTVGPDSIPTSPPKPDDGPDDGECKTASAEVCATLTSYGVSQSGGSTITTTTTSVMSTCAPLVGCEIQGSSTTSTETGGCTSVSTVTDIWLSCPASAAHADGDG